MDCWPARWRRIASRCVWVLLRFCESVVCVRGVVRCSCSFSYTRADVFASSQALPTKPSSSPPHSSPLHVVVAWPCLSIPFAPTGAAVQAVYIAANSRAKCRPQLWLAPMWHHAGHWRPWGPMWHHAGHWRPWPVGPVASRGVAKSVWGRLYRRQAQISAPGGARHENVSA